MAEPTINVDRLLVGPHVRRHRGVTALSETIRTLEGGHGRDGGTGDNSVELRHVHLGVISLGVRAHQANHTVSILRHPTSPYVVQFIFDDEVSISIDRERSIAAHGAAFLIRPGCDFERQELHGRGATASVMFDGAAVRGRLADRLDRELDKPVVFATDVASSRAALLAMMVSIDRALETGLAAPGDAAIEAMQRAFIDLLLDVQPHSYSEELAECGRGRKALRIDLVRSLVARDPAAKLTVEDLAAIAECSVRSLQANFAKHGATSPMEFVRRCRLELARNRLLDATCHAPIASIATEFGFNSASRFTAEYRGRYGETPSETRERRSSGDASAR